MAKKTVIDTAHSKIAASNWGIAAVIILLLSNQISMNYTRFAIESAHTAGWLLSIYITLLAAVGFFLISKLGVRFPGKDLMDICEEVGGRVLKTIVGIIILTSLLFIVPVTLRQFAEFMKEISFFVSPLSFVTVFLIAGMVAACYAGLEPIIKVTSVLVPIINIVLFGGLVSILPYFDINRMFPVLGKGAMSIFIGGIPKISVFFELIVLLFLAPYIKPAKNFRKIGFASISFTGINMILASIIIGCVADYHIAMEEFLSEYVMARQLNIGRFFERGEAVFIPLWVFSALLYISILFYFIIVIFTRLLNLPYYKPFIFSFAILLLNLSFIPGGLESAIMLDTHYFRNTAGIITFLIPTIILAIAKIRKKGLNKR